MIPKVTNIIMINKTTIKILLLDLSLFSVSTTGAFSSWITLAFLVIFILYSLVVPSSAVITIL